MQKNKKNIFIISFLLILLLTACSTNYVNDNMMIETSETETTADPNIIVNPYEGSINHDLTSMSSKMAYSTATSMNMSSEKYLGQIVKMSGTCSVFYDEKNDKYYYTCIINDETACCTIGIEFEPMEEYKFPDDFPKEEETVTVAGVFDSYLDGAKRYKTLRKAYLYK